MLRYQIATTVGACANLLAVLALLQFVGQISQGHGEWEPLIGGGALVLGFLLCLLGDIGRRLVRLEQAVVNGPPVESDDPLERTGTFENE